MIIADKLLDWKMTHFKKNASEKLKFSWSMRLFPGIGLRDRFSLLPLFIFVIWQM